MAVEADVYLPMFVAGRDFADDIADRLGDVAGRTVLVDGTMLRSGTSSFAAQFVRRVLVEGKAAQLLVVGAPQQFVDYLRDEAEHAGVSDALTTSRYFPESVRG
jgi:uncharacterized Fe-S center protein